MESDSNPDRRRETCLPWMLGFFFIGGFVLLLVVATGGFFVYVMGLVAVVAVVAGLHYALWGRGLDESVAGEREEEEMREAALEDERWRPDGDGRFRPPPTDR